MKVKLNGAVHVALSALSEVTEIEGTELAQKVKAALRSLDTSRFVYNTLQYMVEQEWVLKNGSSYTLSMEGRMELEGLKQREVTVQIEKVKHKLHYPDKKTTYMGESMICPTYRAGAFDYMDCKSIMGSKAVDYHISSPHKETSNVS